MEKKTRNCEEVECIMLCNIFSWWLHKFKLRHGLTSKTVRGESGDIYYEKVDEWVQNQLPDLIIWYEQKTFSM